MTCPDYDNRLPSGQVSADQTADVLVIRSVTEQGGEAPGADH